jgi:hypothetical protein
MTEASSSSTKIKEKINSKHDRNLQMELYHRVHCLTAFQCSHNVEVFSKNSIEKIVDFVALNGHRRDKETLTLLFIEKGS